jgi:hypothetical protein
MLEAARNGRPCKLWLPSDFKNFAPAGIEPNRTKAGLGGDHRSGGIVKLIGRGAAGVAVID